MPPSDPRQRLPDSDPEETDEWLEALRSVASYKGSKRARITGVEKLDDANDAGTKNSKECTLILTEGDSAKALAMAGVNIIGIFFFNFFLIFF